ncbi:hypothetical protein OBE_09132, partial [human gut metagenome]
MLRLTKIFLGNLKFCYLWSLFDVVEDRSVWLTRLEIERTILKKPDPSGALKAAKICGADPSECLYFGDTNTDMKTGK